MQMTFFVIAAKTINRTYISTVKVNLRPVSGIIVSVGCQSAVAGHFTDDLCFCHVAPKTDRVSTASFLESQVSSFLTVHFKVTKFDSFLIHLPKL